MAKCYDCGKRLKPIAVIQGERFYHECDWCLHEFCDDCSAETSICGEVNDLSYDTTAEDNGLCKCHTCTEQACIDKRNGREPQKPMN